ncbi:MAG: isopentenyl transferase family protein [Anaerolineales bacterium]
MHPHVYLISGAPGAGKTTLGIALALQLGITSLTVDDLVTAVQAVTTPETHPGLHLMWKTPHTEYFTESTVEKLVADAQNQHRVVWPIVERVIRRHIRSGTSVVIDGWHIWPEFVTRLTVEGVSAAWIVVDLQVLEARERANTGWLEGSADPEKMLRNFLGRSLWFNQFFETQAKAYGMKILMQNGTKSVGELINLILDE